MRAVRFFAPLRVTTGPSGACGIIPRATSAPVAVKMERYGYGTSGRFLAQHSTAFAGSGIIFMTWECSQYCILGIVPYCIFVIDP